MPETLLALRGVRAGYGDAVVLDDVSLEVPRGESLAVLGRNGVGKSTLLLTIMGFASLLRGSIVWRGEDITRLAPHVRPRRGLGWVAQEREIFPSLSVVENLTVAACPGRWNLEDVFGLFPRLGERRQARGNHLSGGEQQMLAIARALMTNPSLLLLDEPLEGLAPIIVEELFGTIRRMTAEHGTTIVIVEQHADIALALSQQAIVLERGTIAHRSRSRDLLDDAALLDRFIGLALADDARPSAPTSPGPR
jgi:branched-chain amino acid transport system ATP-binding protein